MGRSNERGRNGNAATWRNTGGVVALFSVQMAVFGLLLFWRHAANRADIVREARHLARGGERRKQDPAPGDEPPA